MSFLDAFTAGFGFRSATPEFDAGDELTVIVTGIDADGPIARVGDTIFRVPDAPADAVDAKVRIRVTAFDDNDHEGEAEFVERVGETAFAG
jgi:hypothetical protein